MALLYSACINVIFTEEVELQSSSAMYHRWQWRREKLYRDCKKEATETNAREMAVVWSLVLVNYHAEHHCTVSLYSSLPAQTSQLTIHGILLLRLNAARRSNPLSDI
jgi:hypothetical protein